VRDRVDGCSALGLTPTMNTYFRVACNIHDICYHTPDKDRATCDAEFRQNMLALCAIPSSESAHCASWAGTAYAAVVAGGQPAYDADQEWYSDHCSVGTPAAGTNWGMVKAVYR
jgi:hypothetical protein